MPKKKKKAKKSTGRRKGRVGGIGKGELPTAAGVIAGVVATKFANQILTKQFPKLDTKIVAAIPGAIGALVLMNPMKMKALESPLIKGAAYGLVGGSAANVAKELGIVSGIGQSVVLKRRVAGPSDVPFIGSSSGNGIEPKPQEYAYNRVPFVGNPGAMNSPYSRRAAGAM